MEESTSTSSGAPLAGASTDPAFMVPCDSSSATSSASIGITQAFHFTSGNPRIEETRGVMHLFIDDLSSSSSKLPVERKTLLCVLGVPNHMTYADFCQFCGSFIQHMLEMRIVRNDGVDDQYSVLIKFDDQSSTDAFYQHFNGRLYSSLEVEACRVLFTVDVQYTESIEHVQTSAATSTEQNSCPVCLEKLDQETGGILTTICNHSFHCSCISNWTDSSCPVCRYCQQQPEKSKCFICETSENLWMCVICGFVGCGRYKGGHAEQHWKETEHCYSLELETRRVWDYAGDNYVHRLIQSKTDGKFVELNERCTHADGSSCGGFDCKLDAGLSEVILDSRVEAIVQEYNELLTTQLESQKKYFESMLQEVEDEVERKISEAVKDNQKLQRMQTKLDSCIEEKQFLDEINGSVKENLEILKAKMVKTKEWEAKTLKLHDEKLQELEDQLKELMISLEMDNEVVE
ncbi:BRAP2 RING ZnF UBP domain-containing protein 2 [Impatiens glandulifera]|uniref:BRAP2 RING ZnF UBP domain-containing protein 2 n=1 Tax=Impatiens glandulifera TaxID=253017 RepID=UPI001FB1987F|nr:BRAP2 RING ZnF UBP domain-containing protein 2 [Impatiens glandulifera]